MESFSGKPRKPFSVFQFPEQPIPICSFRMDCRCFRLLTRVLPVLLFILVIPSCIGIRSIPAREIGGGEIGEFRFVEAPEYRNGIDCLVTEKDYVAANHPALVHIAMTLDSKYLRGSIAAVHSVLKHSSCPENVVFHFIAAESDRTNHRDLTNLVRSTFPSLNFKVYVFREEKVTDLISSSIREALENPLNYARNYLGDILHPCVKRVIYLDSDLIVVDDIYKLWNTTLSGSKVIGAPEYCHANFTIYFTDLFWSNRNFSKELDKRNPCYFNTGVMVMDLVKWRNGDYTNRLEYWMHIQRKQRIYELGSLPPFLLVFAGEIEPIDHRWNQHGLGGHNVRGSCRSLHPGPVSLLHWSGKGKPWTRLDEKNPCPLDFLWEPYDLYRRHKFRRGFLTSSQSPLIGYSSSL